MPSQTRTVCRIILIAIAIAAIGGVHAAPPVKDTPPSPTITDHILGSLYDVITGKGATETPEQIKNSLKTADLEHKSREYPNIEYTPPLSPTEVTKVLLPDTSIALLRYILERLPYGPLANRDLVIRYAQLLHGTKLPKAFDHPSESDRFTEVCNTFGGDASTPGRFIQHFCHWFTPLMSLKDKTKDGTWTPPWLFKLSGYRGRKGTIALLLVQIMAEIRLTSRGIHPDEKWAHQVEEETYALLTIRYPELLPDVIFAVKRHIKSVPSSSGKRQKPSKAILDTYLKPLWGQQALNAFKESLEGLVKKSYNQVIPKPVPRLSTDQTRHLILIRIATHMPACLDGVDTPRANALASLVDFLRYILLPHTPDTSTDPEHPKVWMNRMNAWGWDSKGRYMTPESILAQRYALAHAVYDQVLLALLSFSISNPTPELDDDKKIVKFVPKDDPKLSSRKETAHPSKDTTQAKKGSSFFFGLFGGDSVKVAATGEGEASSTPSATPPIWGEDFGEGKTWSSIVHSVRFPLLPRPNTVGRPNTVERLKAATQELSAEPERERAILQIVMEMSAARAFRQDAPLWGAQAPGEGKLWLTPSGKKAEVEKTDMDMLVKNMKNVPIPKVSSNHSRRNWVAYININWSVRGGLSRALTTAPRPLLFMRHCEDLLKTKVCTQAEWDACDIYATKEKRKLMKGVKISSRRNSLRSSRRQSTLRSSSRSISSLENPSSAISSPVISPPDISSVTTNPAVEPIPNAGTTASTSAPLVGPPKDAASPKISTREILIITSFLSELHALYDHLAKRETGAYSLDLLKSLCDSADKGKGTLVTFCSKLPGDDDNGDMDSWRSTRKAMFHAAERISRFRLMKAFPRQLLESSAWGGLEAVKWWREEWVRLVNNLFDMIRQVQSAPEDRRTRSARRIAEIIHLTLDIGGERTAEWIKSSDPNFADLGLLRSLKARTRAQGFISLLRNEIWDTMKRPFWLRKGKGHSHMTDVVAWMQGTSPGDRFVGDNYYKGRAVLRYISQIEKRKKTKTKTKTNESKTNESKAKSK